MGVKEEFIAKIVAIEWKMFQAVTNIGGRAACQENHVTFNIMRSSQAMAWSEPALASYLEDLAAAEAQGRNLLTEKYARMMEFTTPEEYARIRQQLPPLEQETRALIDQIAEISLAWTAEIDAKFPYIRKRGRPASAADDTPDTTSIETYLRGELATYSPRTLALYYQNILEQTAKNINGAQIVLEAMMQRYGFHSLAEANDAIRKQTKGDL